MKKCGKCGEVKLESEFHEDKTKKNGLRSWCKKCHNANNRRWQAENSEKNKVSVKKYQAAHPEKVRAIKRKRRALKKAVEENFTSEMEKATYDFFDNKCFLCGSTENLNIDHFYPLSKGNALAYNNALLLCQHCNYSKNNKDPELFFGEEKAKFISRLLFAFDKLMLYLASKNEQLLPKMNDILTEGKFDLDKLVKIGMSDVEMLDYINFAI